MYFAAVATLYKQYPWLYADMNHVESEQSRLMSDAVFCNYHKDIG